MYNICAMIISATSIYVFINALIISLPRTLYIMFKNARRFPGQLFKGKYLFLFITNFVLEMSINVLFLLLSHDFYYLGIFFLWSLLSGIILCLHFVLWIIFWMNGYDVRFQFKKVLVPAPLSVLTSLLFIVSALLSLNYISLILSIVYAVTSFIWNYKGYKITRPVIPDHIPIIEKEE